MSCWIKAFLPGLLQPKKSLITGRPGAREGKFHSLWLFQPLWYEQITIAPLVFDTVGSRTSSFVCLFGLYMLLLVKCSHTRVPPPSSAREQNRQRASSPYPALAAAMRLSMCLPCGSCRSVSRSIWWWAELGCSADDQNANLDITLDECHVLGKDSMIVKKIGLFSATCWLKWKHQSGVSMVFLFYYFRCWCSVGKKKKKNKE